MKTVSKAQGSSNTINPPWWLAQCLNNIQKLGGTICAETSCSELPMQPYVQAVCTCQPPYSNGCIPVNNPPPNCCAFNASSPIPVISEDCYCCCGCYANSTPVAFNQDEYKPILDFQVGDLVYVASDINLTSWSQQQVVWSAGAGDLAAPGLMLNVAFGSHDQHDHLLVTRAQLFLTAGGKLKPAAALVPGQDSLVAADGTPRPVLSLETGMFKGGLHHIATSTKAATSPDNHLLLVKGVVAGDWTLQIALSTRDASSKLPLADGLEDLPEFGTLEYELAVADHELEVSPFRVAVPGFVSSEVSPEEFQPLDQLTGPIIPEDAFAFFTADQAADIAANAPMAPPASQTGKENVLYLFKLFSGFYPTITFTYDEQNQTPNAYFYDDSGNSQLVVAAGLASCLTIKYEGMALVIATMVGAVTGGPPLNDQNLSCLGVASYSAVGGVLPTVWIGLESGPIFTAGLPQITALFDFIDPGHQGGEDTCMNISTFCRLDCMNAAFTLEPLPECAGGLPAPALEVTGAEGVIGLPHGTVTISFNLDVDPVTASKISNYEFDPVTRPVSAKVSATDPTQVLIGLTLQRKTAYLVTVTGVLSSDRQPLVKNKNFAFFKAGE